MVISRAGLTVFWTALLAWIVFLQIFRVAISSGEQFSWVDVFLGLGTGRLCPLRDVEWLL